MVRKTQRRREWLFLMVCIQITIVACTNNSIAEPKVMPSIEVNELIADLSQYRGQAVTVAGWFDMYQLFASKKKYLDRDMSSSIDIYEPTEDGDMTTACESSRVHITGVIVVENSVPTIRSITKVYNIEKGNYCWTAARTYDVD